MASSKPEINIPIDSGQVAKRYFSRVRYPISVTKALTLTAQSTMPMQRGVVLTCGFVLGEFSHAAT